MELPGVVVAGIAIAFAIYLGVQGLVKEVKKLDHKVVAGIHKVLHKK